MIYQIIAAFLGTAAFSVLFNVPRREWIACGLTGAVGWIIYLLCSVHMIAPVATFIAVLGITIIARFLSVGRKVPANIFLIPGIFPVVPGSGIYDTMYYFIIEDISSGVLRGLETIKIAGGIVLGIIVIFSLPGGIFQIVSRKK